MSREIRIVAGPHSYGLTLQLSEEVTVYIGLPVPGGVAQMSADDAQKAARQAAVRALKLAIIELEDA